jgi:hypothetical protein
MKTLDATFSPTHAENLIRAGVTPARAAAILSKAGFGQSVCLHMSGEEMHAVRNVWLADDQPGARSYRDTLVLISKAAPLAKPVDVSDVVLGDFTAAYVECALWSSVGDGEEDAITREHGLSDIAPETLALMRSDCAAFLFRAEEVLAAVDGVSLEQGNPYAGECSHRRAGHDFWLTRNGHGAGFWDGDWPEPYATQLDTIARLFRPVDLCVGDDGLIYQG